MPNSARLSTNSASLSTSSAGRSTAPPLALKTSIIPILSFLPIVAVSVVVVLGALFSPFRTEFEAVTACSPISKQDYVFLLCPIVEAGLTGFALFSAIQCLRSETIFPWIKVSVTVIMALDAGHLTAVIVRTYMGFIIFQQNPDDYYSRLWSAENTAAQTFQALAIMISDFLSWYRLFIVFRRGDSSYKEVKIIGTGILWFAATVVGFAWLAEAQKVPMGTQCGPDGFRPALDSDSREKNLNLAFLSLSMGTVTFSTSLLLLSLWSQRGSERFLWVLSEPATLYSFATILYIILLRVNDSAHALFSTLIVPLILLTFSRVSYEEDTILRKQVTPADPSKNTATTYQGISNSQNEDPEKQTPSRTDNATTGEH